MTDTISDKSMERDQAKRSVKELDDHSSLHGLPGNNEIAKRQKIEIPEGMSKNQWKKLLKLKKREETKDEYKEKKKVKRKALKLRKKEERKSPSEVEVKSHKPKIPLSQVSTNVKVIMDCEFDDLMNNKEIVSLSNQIARCYAARRHSPYKIDLEISSLNKNLEKRFNKDLSQYRNWTGIKFSHNNTLREILPADTEELSKVIYFTADTDEVITELKPDHTYIIGGIVDKNRYKNLCVNKAKELGIKTGKLPISNYIRINGRHVLATSHVFELCCKWFESGKDWREAFNKVLPPRKTKILDTAENNEFENEVNEGEEADENGGLNRTGHIRI